MTQVPPELTEFIQSEVVIHVGTHDERLYPMHLMAWSGRFSEDRQSLTVFIPKAVMANTLRNLESNGRAGVTINHIATMESFQFKGRYSGHRDTTAQETEMQLNAIGKLNNMFSQFGYPEGYMAGLQYDPAIAVTIDIEAVFRQTPGPGAGQQIY